MRTSDDDCDLATNMKGLRKSPDRSPDGHVRDGEWPEATTPMGYSPCRTFPILMVTCHSASSPH